MNWSRAKSIFLITFLILDLFLGYQLYSKRNSADEIPSSNQQSQLSAEQQMAKGGIKWPDKLPDIQSAAYIKGTAKNFITESTSTNSTGSGGSSSDSSGNKMNPGSDSSSGSGASNQPKNEKLIKEVSSLQKVNGQKIQDITAENHSTIKSELTHHQAVNQDSPDFSSFLKKYVYNGNQYELWKKGGSNTPYVFVQTYQGRSVFSKGQNALSYSGGDNFPPGTLKVVMANGKITGYVQSYLILKQHKQKKEIISPLKDAVHTLYTDDDIPNNSTIDSIELSYYNLIENGVGNKVRLFVPTWHILVNMKNKGKDKEFFVNAITEGILTQSKQGQTGG